MQKYYDTQTQAQLYYWQQLKQPQHNTHDNASLIRQYSMAYRLRAISKRRCCPNKDERYIQFANRQLQHIRQLKKKRLLLKCQQRITAVTLPARPTMKSIFKKHDMHYRILGLDSTAHHSITPAMVNKAYKQLMIQYHPDKNNGSALAEKKTQQLNQARDTLKDPEKKKKYDQLLENALRKEIAIWNVMRTKFSDDNLSAEANNKLQQWELHIRNKQPKAEDKTPSRCSKCKRRNNIGEKQDDNGCLTGFVYVGCPLWFQRPNAARKDGHDWFTLCHEDYHPICEQCDLPLKFIKITNEKRFVKCDGCQLYEAQSRPA